MELQSIIFCGGLGSRMPALCQQNAKCLLPVAGIPMFWFPVNTCIKAGVQDITLIFRGSHKAEVEKHLRFPPPVDIPKSVKFEYFYMDKENEEWGTADVLRSYTSNIKKDMIIMSGDFITDGSIIPVIDKFRAHDADLCCFMSDHCATGPEPGPKQKKSKGRDLIGYVEDTNRIVFLASEDDFDHPVNAMVWLENFPKVHLTVGLNDCHVYIMKRKHLDILHKQKNFASIKADLVPFLVEQQNLPLSTVKCFLYSQPAENGQICSHTNNIGAYFEVNKIIPRVLSRIDIKCRAGQHFDFKKTGIHAHESRIEVGAHISAGCVIKRSVIGNRCHLSEKVRIQNSLLMDSVHIGRGAQINNSILCSGATVEDGAEVSNCLVLFGQRISVNAKVQNEVVEEEVEDGDWAKEW